MVYPPAQHNRRSIRLKGYDYRQPGAYFVTICTYGRSCLFGNITGGIMRLNTHGRIVDQKLRNLPRHFARVHLDAFVVMPNHVHALMIIRPDGRGEASVGTSHGSQDVAGEEVRRLVFLPGDASPLLRAVQPTGTQPGSLGAVVQNFKSTATRKINRVRRTPGAPVWQRNYYEHVVRNERAFYRICRYIAENPLTWSLDRFYENR